MNEMADLVMHLNDMNRGELRQSGPDLAVIATPKPPSSVDDWWSLSIRSNVGSTSTMADSIVLSVEFLMTKKGRRERTIRLMIGDCRIIYISHPTSSKFFVIINSIEIHLYHWSTLSVGHDGHPQNSSLADIWFCWTSEAPSKWVRPERKFRTQLPTGLANPKHLLINLRWIIIYDYEIKIKLPT